MLARRRIRRAAADQLYRTCKIVGNCPEDVVNKIEGKTIADKILIWGSTGVYLGGLGIGTGRGTGGGVTLGGRTVGTGRPALPTGAIGPHDVIPVDTLRPTLPPPRAIPPEVIELPTIPTRPEFEVPVIVHPRPDVPNLPDVIDAGAGSSGGPFRTNGEIPEFVNVSGDVTSGEGNPWGNRDTISVGVSRDTTPGILTRTQYDNPAFEVDLFTDSNVGETSSSDHIIVSGHSGGSQIGDTNIASTGGEEEIPLLPLDRTYDTSVLEAGEEETAFTTSSPDAEITGGRGRRPIQPYGRRYQQIPVDDPAFLDRPAVLVSADNPAYDAADVSLIFDEDLQAVSQGHPDFEDITYLSRPHFETRPGGVRVSRIGARRGTISTRSGINVGSAQHFYYDISDIEPIESIEMQVLGEESGESSIVSNWPDVGDVNTTIFEDNLANEQMLWDDFEESRTVGERTRLILTTTTADVFTTETVQIPIDIISVDKPPTVVTDNDGVHVVYPESTDRDNIPVEPDTTPWIRIDLYGSSLDYDLHPSLLKRRRKRAYL